MAFEFTDQNFQVEALDNSGVVVVDFWAEWCGPCRMVGPIVDELAEDNAEAAKIGKVNVDSNPEIATKYGIRSIPTILFLKGGEEVGRQVGVATKSDLQEKIDSFL